MKKQTKVNIGLLIGIYAIILAVINILVFAIFKPGEITEKVAKANFWWTYAFLMVGFAAQVVALFTIDRKNGLDAIFFGLPVVYVGGIFFGVECVLALLFMTLSAFNVCVPTIIVVLLQLVVLAAFLIITFLALIARNHIAGVDKQIKQNVSIIRNLQADVLIAMEACTNIETKEILRKLSDDIRFSDPMTVPEVELLDAQLQTAVMEIKAAVYDEKYEMIETLARRATLILKERNMKVANSK